MSSMMKKFTLLLCLALLVTGCSWFRSNTSAHSNPTTTAQNGLIQVGTLSPKIDAVTAQVLTNMHLHSWNPNAMTRGEVTGGLFINWKMNDPTITNAVTAGADGNPQHNHDPQVDLLYLMSLAEYHQLHPQDHAYDSDLSHTLTLVLADFKAYSLPKGWIYFYLLKSGLLLQNADLQSEAYNVASNFYTKWYDPKLGFVYDRSHHPGDYSADHTLNCGAALIDAGLRWHQASWVQEGEQTIDHTIAVALDPRYHLFYSDMVVSDDGKDGVQNYQLKPSTQGQAVDALVDAYTLTHRQQYIDVAQQVLQSLFGASRLWDTTYGGFFFAVDASKGTLLTAYKETRSQSLVLVGVDHYNEVRRQQFARQEQQLISVLTDHFYQSTYHGFFYRLAPDFSIYVSRPGQGIGVEDYFTTEAMGDSLDALQQTEMTQ